jgi:hypothetical protein
LFTVALITTGPGVGDQDSLSRYVTQEKKAHLVGIGPVLSALAAVAVAAVVFPVTLPVTLIPTTSLLLGRGVVERTMRKER